MEGETGQIIIREVRNSWDLGLILGGKSVLNNCVSDDFQKKHQKEPTIEKHPPNGGHPEGPLRAQSMELMTRLMTNATLA